MGRGGLMDLGGQGAIRALLGPTNTGKTYRAIQRMLAHRSGMIGLPLRLLAREVYDRLVHEVGVDAVALITGEEKRVGKHTRFWVCTVESMPVDKPVAFLAVDEIQLAADRHRGYVFTDRLLHARGVSETWFLGSETIAPLLRQLVPTVEISTSPRLSTLRHAGHRKLMALPPRTAVVAFSMREVVRLAVRLKGRHGGAAVVFGALSPRTRNAQVELYADGKVDYMVATDAIGMGLNLDVHHVALAGTAKFDGVEFRTLRDDELAQICGRAGRYTRDGTFGTTGDTEPLETETIQRLEQHLFEPIRRLYWRTPEREFSSLDALLECLEAPSPHRLLKTAARPDDVRVLTRLMADDRILQRVGSEDDVRLVWAVCGIPDFGNVLPEHHADLLAGLFAELQDHDGQVSEAWLDGQVRRIDRPNGDLSALMSRLAAIRIWNSVVHRPGWVADEQMWRGRIAAIEDRLSDAMHQRLMARFIDTEASALVRTLAMGEVTAAELRPGGRVVAGGHPVGVIRGLRFVTEAGRDLSRLARKAIRAVVRPMVVSRLEALLASPDAAFGVTQAGEVHWDGAAVARLFKGQRVGTPSIRLLRHEMLEGEERTLLDRRVRKWFDGWLASYRGALPDHTPSHPSARGLLYAVVEAGGWLERRGVQNEVQALSSEAVSELRQAGVELGRAFLWAPRMVEMVRHRAIRLGVWRNQPVELPSDDGLRPLAVSDADASLSRLGFVRAGGFMVRIDTLERLAARGQPHARDLELEPEVWRQLKPHLPRLPKRRRRRR